MFDLDPEHILMALQAYRWARALYRTLRMLAGDGRPPKPGAPGTQSCCSCSCGQGRTD